MRDELPFVEKTGGAVLVEVWGVAGRGWIPPGVGMTGERWLGRKGARLCDRVANAGALGIWATLGCLPSLAGAQAFEDGVAVDAAEAGTVLLESLALGVAALFAAPPAAVFVAGGVFAHGGDGSTGA
jgi:hypothetical protein